MFLRLLLFDFAHFVLKIFLQAAGWLQLELGRYALVVIVVACAAQSTVPLGRVLRPQLPPVHLVRLAQ